MADGSSSLQFIGVDQAADNIWLVDSGNYTYPFQNFFGPHSLLNRVVRYDFGAQHPATGTLYCAIDDEPAAIGARGAPSRRYYLTVADLRMMTTIMAHLDRDALAVGTSDFSTPTPKYRAIVDRRAAQFDDALESLTRTPPRRLPAYNLLKPDRLGWLPDRYGAFTEAEVEWNGLGRKGLNLKNTMPRFPR